MKDGAKKRNRVLLILGGVFLACAVLSMGAAAIGGAAFALARGSDPTSAVSADISLALPARATSADEQEGIVIAGVAEDGPAARAGVERGDILLELDGETVNTHRDLLDALEGLEPGDEVEVLVLHGDEERRLRASLGEQGDRAFLGVIPCCPMHEGVSIHRDLDIAADRGALITKLVEGSPADEAGLAVGDVILDVDGERLGDEMTLLDIISGHEPGDRVTLQVESPADDEPRELTVELGEHPEKEGVAYLGVAYAPRLRGHPVPMPDVPRRVPRLNPESEWFGRLAPEVLGSVTVVAVDPDSPAEDSGLRKGDVILAVDGSAVRTPHDVVSAVSSAEPGDELKVTIRRPDQDSEEDDELEISVTLAEHPEEGERAYLGVSLGFHAIGLRRFGGEWDPEHRREEHGLRDNWHLPFDLPELPEHWELPFDLEELPHQFHFEWPPGDDAGFHELIPGGDSA